jgi:hypothetical protein
MSDPFDASSPQPRAHLPRSLPLALQRQDNELLSTTLTSWYSEAPETLAEWDALLDEPHLPDPDQEGRSRAERWELTQELSIRVAALIMDQFPDLDPQALRDFANPPPDLSQGWRQNLLRSAHDLAKTAKIRTILWRRRANVLEPAEGTTPGADRLAIEAKTHDPVRARSGELLARTVCLLGRAKWKIELVEFLARRMGGRTALHTVALELYNSKKPTNDRVDNVRRQCERTRRALDLKGCPLRLVIHDKSVWLEERR